MADVFISGSSLSNELMELLASDDLKPGDAPSYQLCKTIYEFHPLGGKLVEAPIKLAMSQPREVTVSSGPEERVRKAFTDEWRKLGADEQIANLIRLSRVYGIASIALLVEGQDPAQPLDLEKLWEQEIAFNVFDPLNTSGSLVLNQNPNEIDFLKSTGSVTVQGQTYHRSRVCIKLNEEPIFLGYTGSAFGFVGRSVYQRTLYPLKSYLQTMVADDMIARKAGIIVTKIKQAGSIINNAMAAITGNKRDVVREARTNNVISVGHEDDVTAIELQNVNAALGESRKNILNNIAAGASIPAILVNEETFAEGFGEGTEDARHVALYIDDFRKDIARVYDFFDNVVQHRAWNPEFYAAIQNDFPEEYGNRKYEDAFFDWVEAFEAKWPSLLTEPDSEKSKSDKVKLDAIVAMLEKLLPNLDPENKASLIEWAQDNFNALDTLFQVELTLDIEALKTYEPPQPGLPGEASGGGPGGGPPPGAVGGGPGRADSAGLLRTLRTVGR